MMTVTEQFATLFPDLSQIPDAHCIAPIHQTEYLIDGNIHQWTGEMEKIYSPVYVKTADGIEPMYLGSHPSMTEGESLLALEAAVRAYGNGRGKWAIMPVQERMAHVADFVGRMKAQRASVVKTLMWEIGKTLPDSEKEFDRTIEYMNDTIDALKDLDRKSSRFDIEQGIVAQIRRSPLGVALCMGPFNYPLNETFTTLIPALIMGNTVIFKPPKLGVLLFKYLLDAFKESFPAGVVNTIYGAGQKVVPPLMASGKIDVLAFIGSSRVAGILKKQHPRLHRLRGVLGLDAKNPAIVLPDADLDLAIKECLLGTLSFNGQRCTALKILFVHKSIADAFVEKFSNAVSALKCGMPWDAGVNITPLAESSKPKYIAEILADAIAHGAKVVNENGGASYHSLVQPAVVYPVTSAMRLYNEEQFCPIVPIVPFEHLDAPIEYIEQSTYGQQVSIFSTNTETVAHYVDALVNQVCRVNINSQCQRGPDVFPFAGRKDSAEGTLSVGDALRAFSIRTMVAAKGSEQNKMLLTDIVKSRKSSFLSTDFIL